MNNTNMNQLLKKIYLLKVWVLITNLALVFLAYQILSKKILADEITAKRINVVSENNEYRMVISNETRQHSGRIEGKDMPHRKRPAGIIFFNNEGNESGGIISMVDSNGGKINSGMSFTMDRYNHDQVIQILNNEVYDNNEEKIQRGFLISEFPKGAKFFNLHDEYSKIEKIEDKELRRKKTIELLQKEGARKRIYLGRNFNNETGLTLYDQSGEPKLKIFIDPTGKPKFEYTDNDGKSINLLKALSEI